jgi:hypothetical protein
MTRLAATVLFLPTLFFAAGRAIHIMPRDYASALWRPFAATAIMAVVVTAANAVLPFVDFIKLALDIVLGAMSYAGSLLLLWHSSGRPDTPERDIVGLLEKSWRRLAPLPG